MSLQIDDDDVAVVSDSDTYSEEELFNTHDRAYLLKNYDVTNPRAARRSSSATSKRFVDMRRSFVTWWKSTTSSTHVRASYQPVQQGAPEAAEDAPEEEEATTIEVLKADPVYVKERKRFLYYSILVSCLLGFLLTVCLPTFLPQVLLINVYDIQIQTLSYALLLGCTSLSCFFAPLLVVWKGIRLPVLLGFVGAFFFTGAKFFGSTSFLPFFAALAGLTLGPALTSLYVYVTCVSTDLSQLVGYQTYFFSSLYIGLVHMWTFFGVLIAITFTLIMHPWNDGEMGDHLRGESCGPDFCPANQSRSVFTLQSTEGDRSNTFRTQAVLGLFIAMALGGALISWQWLPAGEIHASGAVSTRKYGAPVASSSYRCCDMSVGKILRIIDLNSLLLLVGFVYIGLQQIFGYVTISKRFVECHGGVWYSMLMTLGLCGASVGASPLAGFMGTKIGRPKIFLSVVIIQVAILTLLLLVHAHAHQTVYFAFVLIGWGICDATLQTTTKGLCSQYFHERGNADAGHALHFVFVHLGQLFGAALEIFAACTTVIIAVCLALLVVSVVTYLVFVVKVSLQIQDQKSKSANQSFVPLPEEPPWIPHVNPVRVRPERTSALLPRIPNAEVDLYGIR